MCGIAGLHSSRGSSADRIATVERMVRCISHRGPDDVGFVHSGPLALGMARLSIIDVEGGHQPLWTEDGQVAVLCNGEIYNHDTWRRSIAPARASLRHAERCRGHRPPVRGIRRGLLLQNRGNVRRRRLGCAT